MFGLGVPAVASVVIHWDWGYHGIPMGYHGVPYLQTKPFEVSLFIALCRVRKSLYRPETRRELSALDCLIVLKGLGPAKFVLPALLIHVRKEIRKRYGFLYNGFEPGTYVQLLYYF